MKKVEKGRAAKRQKQIRLRDWRAKVLVWDGLSAGGFCGFGDWGGFISGLRRLSIGLVTASSRFCRWEGDFARLFFQAPPVHGKASESKAKKCR